MGGLLAGGLPVLPAAAAQTAPAAPSAEQSASEQAVATGDPVEVAAARTEYSQTMANPDGTFTLTQSTEPQRARAADGSWRAIDTTLEKRSDGTVGPKSAVVDLSFSGGGPGAGMLALGRGGQELKLGWPGPLSEPTLDGPTATYRDVLEGVDLQLTATAEGYREVLVVKTAEAAASPELEEITLTATGKGLSVVPGAGGGMRAVDADGNAVFRGPAGQMWDSAGGQPTGLQTQLLSAAAAEPQSQTVPAPADATVPGEGDASAELPVTVGPGTVSVEPDLELLRGRETVYPVFIDPSVGLGVSEWTKLSSDGDKFWKFDEPKGVGLCGNADGYYCGSGYVDRMYFELGPGNLAGKQVLDATFRAYETWSFNCTPYWVDLERTDNISEGTRWPGPKQLDQMGDRYISAGRGDLCSPEQPNQWVEFNDNPDEPDENLTSTVRSLADGKISRLTLMLRAKDETQPRAWKRFDSNAELKVWYVHKPGVPTSVGVIPGTGTDAQCRPASDPVTVTVLTPTVQARVQTKVEAHEGKDEGDLQAEFVMQRSSTDTTSGTWSQVWSGYKPDNGWAPDGTLLTDTTDNRANGGLYRFRARTQSHWTYNTKSGDLFSPYSSWCYLRIDTTAPKAPTITSGAPYVECTANACNPYGEPGQPGTFTFKPNTADSDVKAYRWRLLTSDANTAKQVDTSTVNASVTVSNVTPSLAGVQTLSVEASDLELDKEGRVRWGPPAEFAFKVGLAPGPTGRWRFDDGGPGSGLTVAKDTGESGLRHDVVLRDEAGTGWSTLARRGAGDYSLRLNDNLSDPTQQVGYASTNGVAINTQGSFTVSAWVYLTDASANRAVLSAPGQSGSAFTLYYSSAYNKWVFNRTDQDKAGPVYIRSLADTANPPLRVWTHLAGVFDNNRDNDKTNDTIQLFVNGRPQGNPVVLSDVAPGYEPWTSDNNLQIGRAKVSGTYGVYFMGRIDEVAVWQNAHEGDQIREEHRMKKDGALTNELVAHWDATISTGTKVLESPEDPDNPASTSFPYARGGLTLSATGAELKGDDATALVLDGASGRASGTGPVVDETGSFTVSTRVRLNKALLASKPVGYRGLVAGQATPAGKESSWALWVEKNESGVFQWKFGRTAVDASGNVIDTALAPAETPVDSKEWDTWVDVTGVFDVTVPFTDRDGNQQLGVVKLYLGQSSQEASDEDFKLAAPQQGSGTLSVGSGSAGGTTGHHLPGDLAKIRVWTGAMTVHEVTDQIAQPSA
ncbi:LamG-like jellyroll fold domain-containing protein [Streptomyces sp. HB2AG]|uniref:LamG-like jellyroll fold domain-containing protein n=1 Tax=Streptomyces sp. HB2AG TaxID=2983400 RepID=UPI0022AB3A54|nr:LamG-like jellyroll fold domain-containing protein [Streptomyces sp. HB2AG]MCZ2525927.1 LamG domain-containing protein [Streptomyces sp. HB2AG]